MVGPLVAAAAPTVIASATDDEGLINKLFKIAVLIGVLVLALISIVILSWVLDVADLLGAAGAGLAGIFAKVSLGGIPVIGPAITFVVTAFGFLGRRS